MKLRAGWTIVITLLLGLAACNMPTTPQNLPPTIGPTEASLPSDLSATADSRPVITVSMETECRAGPGTVYDAVGVLSPGQLYEAVGVAPAGDYWLIRDPVDPGSLCWLSDETAILTGNPVGLPTAPAPSTPTPVVTQIGCPTPVGGGPTPVSCPTQVHLPGGSGCPTPVGGGPTPVSCPTGVPHPPGSGCPTPVGGGPTPVTCPTQVPGPY